MKSLINLANLAKSVRHYEIANDVVGVMLSRLHQMHDEGMDVSSHLSIETDFVLGEDFYPNFEGKDFSPRSDHTAWWNVIVGQDYYGLLNISFDGELLCIPLPLLSNRADDFLLQVKGTCSARKEHNRCHEDECSAAALEIEKQIKMHLPNWGDEKTKGMEYLYRKTLDEQQ